MINQTVNAIIVAVQEELMSASPSWETKEEYAKYCEFEQNVANTIRELNSVLEVMSSNNVDANTMKRFAINFIS